MTTARELISDALGDIGVLDPIETMTAEQAAHGLRTLNRIIDSWSAQRLMLHAVSDVVATFAGASASIGPGLTIDVPHPLRLEPGCYYVRSGISYPLALWDRETYNATVMKGMAGEFPQGIYFDRQLPGTVYVWPVPSAPIEYHLQTMQQLSKFTGLDINHDFPAGVANALHWALCERLPAGYNLPVNPESKSQALASRAALRKNNTVVPILSVDRSVIGNGSQVITEYAS